MASQGNFSGAAEQFRDAVRLNPQDADAEANLGSALAQLGELKQAKIALRASASVEARPRAGPGESATRRADAGARA